MVTKFFTYTHTHIQEYTHIHTNINTHTHTHTLVHCIGLPWFCVASIDGYTCSRVRAVLTDTSPSLSSTERPTQLALPCSKLANQVDNGKVMRRSHRNVIIIFKLFRWWDVHAINEVKFMRNTLSYVVIVVKI